MNKVILMGRLTKDPEVRYTQSNEPLAIARYTLAVNRRFKRQGEPDADFINCTTFGKNAEFAEKYLKKGQMISIVGRIQVRSWDDQSGQKRWTTEVVVEEEYFAESKSSYEAHKASMPADPRYQQAPQPQYQPQPAPQSQYQPAPPPMPQHQPAPEPPSPDGFYPIDESIEDDDLPF